MQYLPGLTEETARAKAQWWHYEAGRDWQEPGYVRELQRCRCDSARVVVVVHSDDDLMLRCEACSSHHLANPAWVEPYEPVAMACACDLRLGGCSCGAMEAEMADRGYRRNPVTRLWERVE